jgi:uncharacterized protein YacL
VEFICHTLLLVKGTLIRLSEDGDLVLVFSDFNLTGVAWSHKVDELCSSDVTSAREYIVVDGMANSDLFQVHSIPIWCVPV